MGCARTLGAALGVAVQIPRHILDGFCDPSSYDDLFHNWLEGYTPCFIDITLLGVAHAVAVVLSAIRLAQLTSQHSIRLKLTGAAQMLHIVAAVLSCIALLLALFLLQARISGESLLHKGGHSAPGKSTKHSYRMAPFEWTDTGLAAAAWGSLAAVFIVECSGRFSDSNTWLRRFPVVLMAAAEIAKFRFVVRGPADHGYFFWLYCVYFGVTLVLSVFSLSHWPRRRSMMVVPRSPDEGYQPLEGSVEESGGDQPHVNPEVTCGLWSTLTFGWMSPLMVKGYKKPLQSEDIFEVSEDDRVEVISKQFRIYWAAEMQKANGPSLALASWRTIRKVFLSAVPFKLINDAAQFVGPFFLNKLLGVISAGNAQTLGYTYAVLMLVGLEIGTICDNQHFNRVVRAGFRLRGTLTHQVFRQVLSLTPSARSDYSSGRIFSHVTTDAETLYQLSTSGLGLLSSPLRIIGAMSMLYFQLGWASLVAFVVLILCLPVQAILVRKSAQLLKKAMAQTDERSKLEGEVIGGIDVVKCCAWEDPFWKKIQHVRDAELSILWKTFIIDATNVFLLNAIPTVVSVATFSVYVLAGNHLTAAKAFTSLSLFSVLRMPLFQLPQLISQVINARVALKRIEAFLSAERQSDLQEDPPVQPGETAIKMQGEFTWDLSAPATLVDIDVTVPAGSFVAIVGPTGAAKSSLLAAALGLMQQVAGTPVSVAGSVAFVPQAAFIYGNASVRDNILFGLPYDEERYNHAIQISSLITDLLQMPAGDETELGERGVNVSGGQKQRIAIARAAYADADNILLDDPLSALDAKVAQEVFSNTIVGTWSNKTRMLVTNQLQYARPADLILYMSDGRVTESGTYDDLMAAGKGFAALMAQTESKQSEKSAQIGEDEIRSRQKAKNARQVASASASEANLQELGRKKEAHQARKVSAAGCGDESGRLVEKEGRSTGSVRWSTIRAWITAMGGFPAFLPLTGCFVAAEILRVGATVWLSYWTGVADMPGAHRAIWYLNIYAAISGTQTVIECIRGFLANFLAVRSARHLHNGMLARLLRAPMSFFHTNPLGRIINRFTKDTSDVDRLLMGFTVMFCRSLLMLTSTIVLIGTVTPFALPPLVPILLLFYFLYRYFQATVREVKRLDSITRSPVYTSVSEAINGLSTIRAYKAEPRLIESNARLIDRNVVCTLVQMSCNRWLSVRLETLGALSAFAASALAVEQGGAASTVGLSLSYALQVTQLTNMVVRLASLAENAFNSVERITEYTTAPEEPPAEIPGSCPDGWPSKGEIRFEGVQMRYRAGLPLVLKGLTVTIPPACKAGVVGRTGAGKSSLINCLFRLMELDAGRIVVDGVDISRLGLQQLRSRMAIIPQVPVLFTGTLRENLDPFRAHTDAQVWAALRRAHLAPLVEANPEGLEMEMSEGGAPLSAGQKQLAALARALLKKSKIIVLDEATANVDVETDALIQETVRNEFTDAKGAAATVIAIAHRLHTIIDCDMVLVMDAGRCAEVDSPAGLLSNDDSIFSSMVGETGESTERFLRSAANGEIDPRASLKRSASNARTRAAEPAKRTADGSKTCGAVANKARSAADLLRAALAGLAEAAEDQHVRHGEGGHAFSIVDDPHRDSAGTASHAIAEALETLGEVQQLSRRCYNEYADRSSGGGNGRGGGGSRMSNDGDTAITSRSSSVTLASSPRGTANESSYRLSSSAPRAGLRPEQLLPMMPEAHSDDETRDDGNHTKYDDGGGGLPPERELPHHHQELSPEGRANVQRHARRLRGLRLLGVEGSHPSMRCRTSNDLHEGHRDLQGP